MVMMIGMTCATRVTADADPRTVLPHLPELRAALEEQRRFRVGQLRELSEEAANRAVVSMDDPRAEVTHALRAGAMTALSDIEGAIARMEAGTYGACERCQDEIPLERLEILPMVTRCMRCARAHQHRAG
jgi:DnaK suppressor protein